jgi:allophanate hydrolase subunit 2
MNCVVVISEGERLSFGTHKQGIRGYLAIKGGFISESILGSSSFYKGITTQSRLQKGDILLFEPNDKAAASTYSKVPVAPLDFSGSTIAVFKGPEYDMLPQSFQKILSYTSFEITSLSNRMAYVLKSEEHCSALGIITAPVQPGTVQLTPSGKVIVLMRDAQTTGGYARILQLTGTAMDQLAQKRAGEKLFFKIVDPPFDIPV